MIWIALGVFSNSCRTNLNSNNHQNGYKVLQAMNYVNKMSLATVAAADVSLNTSDSFNRHFPHFINLLQTEFNKNASNPQRIQTLNKLLSGARRKRSVFDVSQLFTHPVSPRSPLLTPVKEEQSFIITNDSRPPLLTPTKKSFVNKKRFDFRGIDDGDFTKLDQAWKEFMNIIDIIQVFTDFELNGLRSAESFGNDADMDMVIGLLMERDWTAVAHLYLLDRCDTAHLLILASTLLGRHEESQLRKQLIRWKEKIVVEHNYRMIWIEGSELFDFPEYKEWDEAAKKVKRIKGLSEIFDLISAWCHEITFHIAHSARLKLRRHELMTYNLWYCPLWLQVIACSGDAPAFGTHMVLSKYECSFKKWMDAVIKENDLKHLRGHYQPKLNTVDIIQYIKHGITSRLSLNNLCGLIGEMPKQNGWKLAQLIAKVLLSLRYEIIRNKTEISTLKHVFKLCLYCFKYQFMNGTWMYVPTPDPAKRNRKLARQRELSLFEPGPLVSSNYSILGYGNQSDGKDLMNERFRDEDFVF